MHAHLKRKHNIVQDARLLKRKSTSLPTRPLSELLFLFIMRNIKANLCLIKSNPKQNKTELQHFESKLKRNEWTLNRPSPRNTIKLPLTSPVQQC